MNQRQIKLLQNFRDLQKARLAALMTTMVTMDDIDPEGCTCSLCGGTGILMKTLRIAPCSTPSNFIQNPESGKPLTFLEPWKCPACEGGVDMNAYMEKLQGVAVNA